MKTALTFASRSVAPLFCILTLAWLPACGMLGMPKQFQGGSDRVGRQLAADIAEVMATNRVYETAVPLLQQGIAEDPNSPRLHRLLGIVLRDRGIYDQAMIELQLAHELAPADADTVAAVGVLYDLMQRPVAAEAWDRHALDINPNKAEYYNNLGFCMYLQGRDYDAVVSFRESLRRSPNQSRVYNNLGFALARLGQHELALRSFEQAGSRATAMANLGVAYEMAGDTDEARAWYLRALKVDQRLEVARRNLHNLNHPLSLGDQDAELPEVLR
jgi:Flp pilus assembly protein TadD